MAIGGCSLPLDGPSETEAEHWIFGIAQYIVLPHFHEARIRSRGDCEMPAHVVKTGRHVAFVDAWIDNCLV
jgi:hypothetical protein